MASCSFGRLGTPASTLWFRLHLTSFAHYDALSESSITTVAMLGYRILAASAQANAIGWASR